MLGILRHQKERRNATTEDRDQTALPAKRVPAGKEVFSRLTLIRVRLRDVGLGLQRFGVGVGTRLAGPFRTPRSAVFTGLRGRDVVDGSESGLRRGELLCATFVRRL